MTVFPPRNLPGEADKWGRVVEDRQKAASSRIRAFSGSWNNSDRSEAGSLSTSSSLVAELLNRRLDIAQVPAMSVSGSATADPFPSTSQTVIFDPAPGVRTGFLTFNANYTVTPLRGTPAVVFLRAGGARLLRLSPKILPDAGINPSESQGIGTFLGNCRVPLPDNQPLSVTVQLYRGPDATASTISLSDIFVTLTRSGAS